MLFPFSCCIFMFHPSHNHILATPPFVHISYIRGLFSPAHFFLIRLSTHITCEYSSLVTIKYYIVYHQLPWVFINTATCLWSILPILHSPYCRLPWVHIECHLAPSEELLVISIKNHKNHIYIHTINFTQLYLKSSSATPYSLKVHTLIFLLPYSPRQPRGSPSSTYSLSSSILPKKSSSTARYHFIRECVQDASISLLHVSTADMLANMLTNPLGRVLLENHWLMFGIIP
jgi:hypothetical protein